MQSNIKNIIPHDFPNTQNLYYVFPYSKFVGDLTNWKPYEADTIEDMFSGCNAPKPYWAEFKNKEERKTVISHYWLSKELEEKAPLNENNKKKAKL